MSTTHHDTPLTRTAAAVVPLLLQAHDHLYGLAAPKAAKIADRIGLLLADLIEAADEVEAYGNKWTGCEMGELAATIRAATAEYHGV